LNLNLLRDERLKWLIALRLMVLNRSATEGSRLTAYAARPELPATTVNYLPISVWGNSSLLANVNDPITLTYCLRIQATRQEVVRRRLGRVEDKRFLEK
jgi:hypothetical protein